MRFCRVHPPVPAPLVASRNIVPAGEDGSRLFAPARHSVADAPPPGGAGTGGSFRLERGCSLGAEVKRAVPLASERNAKHEHDRKPHLQRMPRTCSATHKQHRQADQIPGSTAGMENCFTPRMSHTRHHATVRNSGSGSRLLESAYSRTSILQF